MPKNRPTLPQRMALYLMHHLKLEPPSWEHDTLSWSDQPKSRVRSFRVEANGSKYDLQVTEREFVSTVLSQSDLARNGDDYDRAFTVTIFGWCHTDTDHNPTVGRTYRWREGDHIHGPDFGYKMGLMPRDVDSILMVLESAGHSVKLCNSEEGSEVSYG